MELFSHGKNAALEDTGYKIGHSKVSGTRERWEAKEKEAEREPKKLERGFHAGKAKRGFQQKNYKQGQDSKILNMRLISNFRYLNNVFFIKLKWIWYQLHPFGTEYQSVKEHSGSMACFQHEHGIITQETHGSLPLIVGDRLKQAAFLASSVLLCFLAACLRFSYCAAASNSANWDSQVNICSDWFRAD